ncbi:MAG: hypothetical protein V3G41_00320 [Lachnospiraceae bacterium]|nr:hypothetical protein SAMN02910370_01158 [Lachnospiraceae bacterium XPB1003]
MQSKLKGYAIAVLAVDVIGLILELIVGFSPKIVTGPGALTGHNNINIEAIQVPYDAFLIAALSIVAAILAINGISKERKVISSQYDHPVMEDASGDSDGTVADIISVVLVLGVIPVMSWVLTMMGTWTWSREGAEALAANSWMTTVISTIWRLPAWITYGLVFVCGADMGRKKDPTVI